MPRYRIVEKRCFKETFIVEAASEEEARTSTNLVEEVGATDSWADELLSVELVEDDDE